ncbi:hypothetical protein LBMAG42_15820 [Deltaproteobacteria bacterium]|nr:hypothetical protein LBMAG42_15820 [Deltaproteobacteria bacterium]
MRWSLLVFVLAGCSESYRACDQLCREDGFPGGHALPAEHHALYDLSCDCDGESGGLTQEQCDDFCEEFSPHDTGPGVLVRDDCWCTVIDET